MIIISQKKMAADDGEIKEDKELEEMKMKAFLMSSVIACKAGDIVLEETGFNEA